MRLSHKILSRITDDLIVRINEIYHDFENATYQTRQQHMFAREGEKWQDLAVRFLTRSEDVTCLDYGSGTGFVPLIVGPYLKSSDRLILADLSERILTTCEDNLAASQEIVCQKSFVKMDGKSIPLESASVDVVTLNSVLHHIPSLQSFATECARVLTDNGLLLVAHEPNGGAELPLALKTALRAAGTLLEPSKIAFSLVERSDLLETLARKILGRISDKYRARNSMLEDISRLLIEEGFIDFKLRGTEVQQLVDIHTAEGLTKERIEDAFSSFELVEWRTDTIVSSTRRIARELNRLLEDAYPEGGSSLSFVMKKKG
jgi:ubiquinone/menaquinone biosynthesis C-methylase UbiE